MTRRQLNGQTRSSASRPTVWRVDRSGICQNKLLELQMQLRRWHAVRIANLRNGTSSRCIHCQRLNATPPPNKQKIFCEIGKSYGFWRVLRASDRTGYYECKCEKCGKTTKERRTTQLLNTEKYGDKCRSCAAIEAGAKQRSDPSGPAPICAKHGIQKHKINDSSGHMDLDGFAVNAIMKNLESIDLKKQASLASQQSDYEKFIPGKRALEDGHSWGSINPPKA